MKWYGLVTSWRMSVWSFTRGKGRADSEPARSRDRFTARRKLKASDRHQPENKDNTPNFDETTDHHCLIKTHLRLEPRRARNLAKTRSGLRRSRYHQQPLILRGDGGEERTEPFSLCRG